MYSAWDSIHEMETVSNYPGFEEFLDVWWGFHRDNRTLSEDVQEVNEESLSTPDDVWGHRSGKKVLFVVLTRCGWITVWQREYKREVDH